MAKKKHEESESQVESTETESTASEAPAKAGGSWKAAFNVTCKGADGNNLTMKVGDEVPSDLPKEEMEALIKDGMIVKG